MWTVEYWGADGQEMERGMIGKSHSKFQSQQYWLVKFFSNMSQLASCYFSFQNVILYSKSVIYLHNKSLNHPKFYH